MLNAMLLDRLCDFFRESGTCTNLTLFRPSTEAILDPLGIAACLLLTPPPLVFIHALAFCQETTQIL